MAIDSAYATAAEYRARVNKTGTSEDAEIGEQLDAVSRLLERELGESQSAPRIFNSWSATVVLDGSGEDVLYLPDFAAITAIEVDADADGVYELSFDLSDAWCRAIPGEYSTQGVPITALQLLPIASNSTLTLWPDAAASVKVTGTRGWSAVPQPITEATIMITRHLRDLEEAGFTLSLSNLDAGVQMSPGAQALVRELKRAYSRRSIPIGRWA